MPHMPHWLPVSLESDLCKTFCSFSSKTDPNIQTNKQSNTIQFNDWHSKMLCVSCSQKTLKTHQFCKFRHYILVSAKTCRTGVFERFCMNHSMVFLGNQNMWHCRVRLIKQSCVSLKCFTSVITQTL
jgi:hypothetical protein